VKKRETHRDDRFIHRNGTAAKLRDIILGGQDGIVNVLGNTLGVAAATGDMKITLIAGLAATFAESISMGAVAYTSTEAAKSYAKSLEQQEKHEIEKHPAEERAEIKKIFSRKGLRGLLLTRVVERITASKRRWLLTMMAEELHVSSETTKPLLSAIIVFLASLIGSLIPLIPYVFMSVKQSMFASVIICSFVLLACGGSQACR
jgi:VIT1/CCC1 family predicted Fe2+/Mn2+ transporter